jgi:hypothetical protein
MSTTPAKTPEILDKIVDLVLAHKPKTSTQDCEEGEEEGSEEEKISLIAMLPKEGTKISATQFQFRPRIR